MISFLLAGTEVTGEPTKPPSIIVAQERASNAPVLLRAEAFTLEELQRASAKTCARVLNTTKLQGFINVQLPSSEAMAVQV